MASINLDKPLERPHDAFSLLRAVTAKSDAPSAFDDHFQRLAPPSKESKPAPQAAATNRPSAPAATTARENSDTAKRPERRPDEPKGVDDGQASASTAVTAARPATTDERAASVDANHIEQDEIGESATADREREANKLAAADAKPRAAKGARATKLNAAAKQKPDQSAMPTAAVAQAERVADPDKVQVQTPEASSEQAAAALVAAVAASQPTAEATGTKASDDKQKAADKPAQRIKMAQAEPTTQAPISTTVAMPPVDAISETETEVAEPVATEPAPAKKVAGSGPSARRTAANLHEDSAIDPAQIDLTAAIEAATSAQTTEATQTRSAEAPSHDVKGATPVETNQQQSAAPVADRAPVAAAAAPAANQATSTGGASATRTTDHATSTAHSTEVDRVRFVQRVSRALQTAGEGNGSLRLRLSPPELGSVRLEVTIKDGTMTARLEAETPAARAALLESCPDLQHRLAEHDIKLERFEVDLSDRGGLGSPHDSQPGNAGAERDSSSAAQRGKARRVETAAVPAASVAAARIISSDQLNVVI